MLYIYRYSKENPHNYNNTIGLLNILFVEYSAMITVKIIVVSSQPSSHDYCYFFIRSMVVSITEACSDSDIFRDLLLI